MSQDLPIPRQEERSADPAVVEWGESSSMPPPAGRLGRGMSGLRRDPRLPVLLAGLGALAAVASLVGEWSVMTIPNAGPEGDTAVEVPGGVAEVGGFGVAYLVALVALSCAVALALRGTRPVRPNARVAGSALAVATLAILAATVATLDNAGRRALIYAPDDGFQVEQGRGLVAAFVTCVLLVAALLVGPRDTVSAEPGDDADAPEPDVAELRAAPRRRATSDRPADGLPPPADITVAPAVPFARGEPPR
ncbi:hypothetical protein GA0070616_2526 [Micromonospora nigra]|uniref:Tryptophan-associated transmembrane protein (Trp_oprn_chp) n=1 Tax=Micromonospora nigra TaxID=145857 RepID=A0A1C6RZ06_9ACTN|nr:hypothetical protein [Micromonospora nigra]SCL22382.1 hypothetical protein GA0070616_2526 [Micromonospora nigra]